MTIVHRWLPPQPLAAGILRGRAQSFKDTGLRRGLSTCRKDRGKWVDSGYTAPECALEMNLPPSSPHAIFTIPQWWQGTAALPLDILCLLFLQHGVRHTELLKAPGPSTPYPQQGKLEAGTFPFLAPSLQPFLARIGRKTKWVQAKKL